jgi:site-specific DNA-methyltransferase (adenine-specific)
MNSDFDIDILNDELMNSFDTIDMSDFGFDIDFDIEEEQEIVEDEIPDIPEEPKAKLGDIYQLGNHRLMCGDSTSEINIEKLLDGNKVDLLFTDPPYNMHYSGMGIIPENERVQSMVDFDANSINWLSNTDFGSMYIFTSKDLIPDYLKIFKDWKFNILIWEKTNNPPLTMNTFLPDIEYLLYFHNGNRIWNNSLKPMEIYKKVYSSSRQEGQKEIGNVHPTMKPINLICDKLKISSNENSVVLDLFGGSGSTLIACEQLNRKCYMMELDPHYIDVIIERWENFTGEKAVKIEGE